MRLTGLRSLAAACVLALLAAETAVAAGDCEAFLSMRERLAPVEVGSVAALSRALSGRHGDTIEVLGEVSGTATSALATDGLPRTVMMRLDDGATVTLRASDDAGSLRVGDRVAVIASVTRMGGTNDLVVEAWAPEWSLPREQPEPDPPSATNEPEMVKALLGDQLPRPDAAGVCRVDAVGVWRDRVLEHNERLTEAQATNIARWVLHYAQQYDVNHKLIFALIRWESWFDPSCVSHAGAIGLMQLMPGTARSLGVNPRNVQQNIDGGTHYLAEQLARYADRPNYERVILALACYNAGPNAVARAGHRVPAYPETQRYVRKVSQTFYELHQAGMP